MSVVSEGNCAGRVLVDVEGRKGGGTIEVMIRDGGGAIEKVLRSDVGIMLDARCSCS